MQITKDQLIAGQPALKVCSLVRAYRILSFYTSEFEKVLNLSPAEAEDFAREMVNLGFLSGLRRRFTVACSPCHRRRIRRSLQRAIPLANCFSVKLCELML